MDVAKKMDPKKMKIMASNIKNSGATLGKRLVSGAMKAKPEMMALVIGIVMLVLFFVYGVKKMNKFVQNNLRLEQIYSDFPKISTINTLIPNNRFSYKLRDYYVKTAYNCCSSGDVKNDYVSEKALKTCIRQGARCLDFQIFSIDNRPVIAVSGNDDYSVKGSYNDVPFATAMKSIANYAFSPASCPCSGDPLILHFRVMTNNVSIMETMAHDIQASLASRTLGKDYSFENHGENIGSTKLKELKGKVVIIVDKSHANPTKTKLDEYVNLTSNSAFMRTLRYRDVKFTPDMKELVDYNKKNMSMCIPDVGEHPDNPSPTIAHKYGCQFVAMSFPKMDDKMRYYTKIFDQEGSAFALKPESLRYIPVTVNIPPPARPELSYKDRKIESDFYSLKI
tara:strand:+ start:344 stop:1525 length:1182 start_codon:yes stop_codon:yes gene_type:complete